MKFASWYKNIIESLNPEPPENAWNNIQDQLDIDNSWSKINSYLNKQRFLLRLRTTAAASVIILTISASAWLILKINLQDNAIPEAENHIIENPVPEQEQRYTGITQNNEPEIIESENTTAEASVNDFTSIIIEDDVPEIDEVARAEEPVNPEDERNIEKIDPVKPYLTSNNNIKPDYIDPISNYQAQSKQNNIRKVFRKLYFGAGGQLANTWLINQKTISGLKSTSLVTTNPSFGSNFGVFAGTNLLKNLDLQLDLNILAQNNQDYNEYLNGTYVSSNMRFNYTQLGLSFRYFLNSNTVMKGEHALNIGPYLGYLHNASRIIGQETVYITDTYNTLDYGLQAGYEYVFPIFDRLGMGTGFRAYYGLNNIYAGNETIPDYLNITNNASVNITLSFKYLVK